MLDALEQLILKIETDMVLKNAENAIASIPYLKNDIAHVKAQLDAFLNSQNI